MLITNEAKTPKFYTQPKIHKPNNPGRPVISSINCHTANISKFVDYHLQDHVTKLPSYLKDTTDFINKTKDLQVPPNTILATLDVCSLYTNIPNKEGIESIRTTLTKAGTPTPLKTIIITFLTLILTRNNFVFNGTHYIQIKGCAMGTKCAPTYANLFMGEFEEKHIYNLIKEKTKKYLRFIDDIFLVWTASEQELLNFHTTINSVHPSIKFTMEYSKEKINYLDTTVFIKDSKLVTKTFKKPTDRSAYLHNKSYHPSSLKTNIPYGQALRLKKICTSNKDYQESLTELNNAFIKRGYQQNNLTNQFTRANNKDRNHLLQKKPITQNQTNRIPFITTYNKNLPNLKQTMNKHWHLLKINPDIAQSFQQEPIIAYRRNKNLRDLIGQTTIKNNKVQRSQPDQKGKCRPCLSRAGNLCCKQVSSTNTFTSRQTNKTYNIRHNTNCHSNHVIYLMECKRCNIQYIGKSEPPFNCRLKTHRYDANHPKQDTIQACKHYSNTDHNFNRDAQFTIIEQINDKTKSNTQKAKVLLQRENFWITELKTLTPYGFNQELNIV